MYCFKVSERERRGGRGGPIFRATRSRALWRPLHTPSPPPNSGRARQPSVCAVSRGRRWRRDGAGLREAQGRGGGNTRRQSGCLHEEKQASPLLRRRRTTHSSVAAVPPTNTHTLTHTPTQVLHCAKRYCHDWTTCPYAHPGEKAARRDPRGHIKYTGIACPDMKAGGACARGDVCPYAHNVFEYWLHPTR